MLTIRPAQMKALEHTVEQTFENRLAAHLSAFLATRHRDAGLDYIHDQIRQGIALCPDFGLERQSDIARYFEIVLGSLGGFSSEPLPKDALNILYTYRMDPELKLKRLEEWTRKVGK